MTTAPRETPTSEPPARLKAIGLTDVGLALGLPLLTMISWGLPQAAWRPFSRMSAPFYGPALSLKSRSKLTEKMRRIIGDRAIARQAGEILRDVVAEDIVSLLELLREYRPGGWKPKIEMPGRQHVADALDRGRGVILWVSYFVHADLVAKMAFHRFGLQVSHFSHPRHGFTSTRFGMKYLNPLQTRVEDRYLRRRVQRGLDNSTDAIAMLGERLRENGVVSLSVRGDSRRPIVAPFFDGEISIAAGASVLAHKTGAALIPVFPVRNEAGDFTVFIEPPLDLDPAADRGAAVEAAVKGYVGLLEDYVLRYPNQWQGWFPL